MWQWQPQWFLLWPLHSQWHPLKQITVAMPSTVKTCIWHLPQWTIDVASSLTNGTSPTLVLTHLTLNSFGISWFPTGGCTGASIFCLFCKGSSSPCRSGVGNIVSPSGLQALVGGSMVSFGCTSWLSSWLSSKTVGSTPWGWSTGQGWPVSILEQVRGAPWPNKAAIKLGLC